MRKYLNDPFFERRRKKRFEQDVLRRKLKRLRRRFHILPTSYIADATLSFLRHNKVDDLSQYDDAKRAWVIRIPRDFSFTGNPDETLATILSVVAVSRKHHNEPSICFDHRQCVQMELGASVALDVVTLALRAEWRSRRRKFRLFGYFPDDPKVRNILQCMGITKHLRVRGAEATLEIDSQFEKFPLFVGRKKIGTQLQVLDQEIAATNLATYLDQCYRKAAGFTFTREGQRQILKWAGEVITNAEEHSKLHTWYAIAYMTQSNDSNLTESSEEPPIAECQLCVFDFGATICETLNQESTPLEVREEIQRLVTTHASKNFFNPLNRFTQENLWTLYALQDGVTRFSRRRAGDTSRGKGTVQMIEAFQILGSTLDQTKKPEMTLISGKTRIYFNDTYRLSPVSLPGGQRQIIAFNEDNDLEDRPDPQHVHSLKSNFPGTLLTCRFYIDKRYLIKLEGASQQN